MTAFTIHIPQSWRMTDEMLYDFCIANRDKVVERDANRQIIIMAPVGGLSSYYNGELTTDLVLWNRKNQLGITFDSSGGFFLPDGSMRSPDAAWISNEKWEKLSEVERTKFPPLCPDFVIELRSKTDRLGELQSKMEEWMANGCQLAWLIDPANEQVFVFRKGKKVEQVSGFDRLLSGEEVLRGFELDLRRYR